MIIKLSSPEAQEFWQIPIVYEDDHLLGLDKPAGLPAFGESEFPERPNLMGLLHRAIADGKSWVKEKALTYLMPVQRLDAEMSGVLLLAKSKQVLTKLSDLFGSEQPVVTVVTLVKGSPVEENFRVDAKLAPNTLRTGLMRIDARMGKRARSDFNVLERFVGWTLLKCVPLTWRRHQLRVHLARKGLFVAGDRLYGGSPLLLSTLKKGYRLKPHKVERALIGSPILHCEQLSLAHPVTGSPLNIRAEWPKDLLVAVKYLRLYAAG